MASISLIKRIVAVGLCAQIVVTGQFAAVAQAEMVSTGAAVTKYLEETNRTSLLSELQKEEIRSEFLRLGVDPDEAQARLEALSDAEVAMLLEQIDTNQAGGGSLIGALLTVFIILLVTDLLCLTKVFKFTRCAR